MLPYFFISLNLMHDQLIHETNLPDNDNDSAAAGPAAFGRVGPAKPGPTLSSCTMYGRLHITIQVRLSYSPYHTWSCACV